MPDDLIRYDVLVQDALKGVVRKVLADAAREGLKGEHHFYVTFRTRAQGVRLSQRLRDKYADEMTIVLQHMFWDLGVTEHTFEVGLSFDNIPERLLIPFDAVTGFYDPSVQFGLKFEPVDEEGEGAEQEPAATAREPKPARNAPKALPQPARQPLLPGKAAEPAAPAAPAKPKAERRKEPKPSEPPANPPAGEGADVVSLDAFRKKK